MKRPLLVYIERLREGKVEHIEERIDPALLNISEEDIVCKEPVSVTAEVYCVDMWLIVKISLSAQLILSCAFCNETFVLPIEVKEDMHEESLEDTKEAIFDLLPLVREALLVEVPFYPQCGTTSCRNRSEMEKYLKKEDGQKHTRERYLPFEDLSE